MKPNTRALTLSSTPRYAGLKKYAAYREDAAHLPKQFNKRRWEYFKKHEGFEKELDGIYEEMSKKKGPSKGSKKDDKGKGKKKRDRNSSKRKREDADDDAGEGPSSAMPEWKKKKQEQHRKKKAKDAKKQDTAVDGGGIAADRLSSYTASTKRSKNPKK